MYRDGEPAVYLNGALAGRGKKSPHRVHPVVGKPLREQEIPYFEGDMSDPQEFTEALGEERIAQLVSAGPPPVPGPPVAEPARGDRPGLLIWQDGHYQLRARNGEARSFQVEGLAEPVAVPGP